MKYVKETTVMYADTDSYQVVWHGSYLRWLEEGRFSLCKLAGVEVDKLDANGITFPIVDMHVRYKSPARIFEDIVVETRIADVKSRTVTFFQTIKNKETGEVHINAEFVCVAVSSKETKLLKMPEEIFSAFKKIIE